MARIEDYALLGDTRSAALVGRDGSVDWLCWPRFDSDALFAALLGDERQGRWQLAPAQAAGSTRRYRPDSMVLETDWRTPQGVVRVVDSLGPPGEGPLLLRVVEGLSGEVPLRSRLGVHFGYGDRTPWVHRTPEGFVAAAGPDAVLLRTRAPVAAEDGVLASSFQVRAGDRVAFALCWHPSHEPAPPPVDPFEALGRADAWWRDWSARSSYEGPWRDELRRSLLVLKALIYEPTGGIVAAPTTSLPEHPGGVRNWDYRYCWLRDATLTLLALLDSGHREEAAAWRDWLVRAVAGEPDELQILYGIAGERRLPELELPWLPGYEGARPVRVGNAAASQRQLDAYGEVMDCLYEARLAGLPPQQDVWQLQSRLVEHLAGVWRLPDEGIWEVRGPARQFTHSKVMVWVAFDRAVKAVERLGLPGPVERWRGLRAQVHDEVCRRAWDSGRSTFTQVLGESGVDASLLLLPLVGFLPPQDPRVPATVDAVRRELAVDGLVLRHDTRRLDDGLPAGEGAFLACSFWLVDCLALLGREPEAQELFEHLLGLRNDVGLLAEEYDPRAGRMLGNFPQAFSHLALVNSVQMLSRRPGSPARRARP